MDAMDKKLLDFMKSQYPQDDWKHHISIVMKYSKYLAELEHENIEIAELSALLHDIGGYRHGWTDHHKTGAIEAEKILKDYGYDKKIIDKVKECIEAHPTSATNNPKNKLITVMRDADTLAHFDAVPWFIGLKNEKNYNAAIKWVSDKLDNDYNHKLHLEESKRIAKGKYAAAKIVLGN